MPRLVALPAVADISVVVGCLLPAQAVSPRSRLSLQFPAEHFVHIYRGQPPGGERGQILCYGESEVYLLRDDVVIVLVDTPHIFMFRLQV